MILKLFRNIYNFSIAQSNYTRASLTDTLQDSKMSLKHGLCMELDMVGLSNVLYTPHHKANMKIVIELKCIETTTTKKIVFTALHGMQQRSYDEISVRPSVCQTRAL